MLLLALLSTPALAQTAPLPNPQCSGFFDVSLLSALNVTKGTTASFPIVIENNAGAVQTISLVAVCDVNSLLCTFEDVPFTNTLGVGEQRTVHLEVDTSRAAPGRYTFELQVSGGTATDSCTESTLITLGVMPSTTPAPQNPAVQAYIDPSQAMLKMPGEEVEYVIGLINEAPDRAIVSIRSQGNPFEKGTIYDAVEVSLNAGETEAIRAKVKLPAGVPGGDYPWTFVTRWITATRGPSEITLPARVRIQAPTIALQLMPDPSTSCIGVGARAPASTVVDVRNNGDGKATVVASIEGSPATKEFITVSPAMFELKAGESAKLKIDIKPQRTTTMGAYNYRLVLKNLDYTLVDRSLCAVVQSSSDVEVDGPESVTILRTRTQSSTLKVRNIGNSRGEYATEAVAPQGVVATTDPASFTLLPGEERNVNLVLQSNLRAQLGPGKVALVFRPRQAAAATIEIPAEVVSTNQSGESYLRLETAPTLEVVDGIEKTIELRVTNTGSAALKQVTAELIGVPESWYEAQQRDIGPGQTATIPVTITAINPEKDLYQATIALYSGLESVRYSGSLSIAPQVNRLQAGNLTAESIKEGTATREVLVSVSLKNTGNTPATDIKPIMFSTGGALDEELFAVPEKAVALNPGEERTMFLRIKPAAAQSGEKTGVLKLESKEGAEASQEIKVPALQSKGAAAGVPWLAIIAVVLLLIGVFAYIAKQEYWFGRTPPPEGEGAAEEAAVAGREEWPDLPPEQMREFLKRREGQLLSNQRVLKASFVKKELNELTFKRLMADNEEELEEVREHLSGGRG